MNLVLPSIEAFSPSDVYSWLTRNMGLSDSLEDKSAAKVGDQCLELILTDCHTPVIDQYFRASMLGLDTRT